MTKAEIMNETW